MKAKYLVSDMTLQARETLSGLWDHWEKPSPAAEFKFAGLVILGSLLLTPLVRQLPLLGFDWFRLFYAGNLDQYPPWMDPLFAPFRLMPADWSLALIASLTLVTVAAVTFRQSERGRLDGSVAVLMALLTPPLWYLLWDGQIDGLVLLAFLILPWSTPIVLLRPQITAWLMLSRRTWTVAMVFWLAASLILWGPWIFNSLTLSQGSVAHPTSMGWATLGWPILLVGLAMLLTSRGNVWRILAASFLASPYVQPYHFAMLLPALGRVHGWQRLALWLAVWLVGAVPGFLGVSKYLALAFPMLVWFFLRNDSRDSFV